MHSQVRSRKLAVKIALVLIGISIIASAGLTYVAHQTGSKMLAHEVEAKANSLAGFSKAILEHLMLEGKSQKVIRALKTAVKFPQVKEAFVLLPDWKVALEAHGEDTTTVFPWTALRNAEQNQGERYLAQIEHGQRIEYVASEIRNRTECMRCHEPSRPILGYLVARISTDDLYAIALNHRTSNILMTVVSFVGLAAVAFIALVLVVVRPINKLHDHMKDVGKQIQMLERGEETAFSLLPEPDADDEVGHLAKTFNDLMRRLNEANASIFSMHSSQLQRADRVATVGEMAASLAHEIRNPVAGVLGALQIFDSEIPDESPRKEIIREMMLQMGRVNQAINDLLSYARPTPPVFEDVPLHDVIQKTITLLSQQIKGKHVVIRTELADNDLTCSVDKKMIQQVLWNIMLNGIQAMGDRGALTIRTVRSGDVATVEIEDTGNGINMEHVDKIFKPFFTTKHQGTGLGLAICKRILEQHKGTISVRSKVGKGTVFTFGLPLNHPSAT